jgi:hypothetical protein
MTHQPSKATANAAEPTQMQGNARRAANAAKVAALSPLDLLTSGAQFSTIVADPPQRDAVVRTADLAKTSNWERGSFIEKSSYATMPGSDTADSDVARACAALLATSTGPKR